MGQYFYVVNLDKKQFLHAHKLDCGLKLPEIAFSAGRVAGALVILLADNPERFEGSLVGSWSGDRIVVAGDYGPKLTAEQRKLYDVGLDESYDTLYSIAGSYFEDISGRIKQEIPELVSD